jgi:hypothetical protein
LDDSIGLADQRGHGHGVVLADDWRFAVRFHMNWDLRRESSREIVAGTRTGFLSAIEKAAREPIGSAD